MEVAAATEEGLTLAEFLSRVPERAATPFAPDDFEDQLQHLTVVQYLFRDPKLAGPLPRPTQDFPTTGAAIAWFEEHTELKFDPIIRACFDVIRGFFQSVCYGHIGDAGERIGLVPDDRVRAIYGLDILLKDQGNGHVQPVLLECNYKPDNRRLFQQRPRFLDQVFDVLYPGPQGANVESCEHRPSVLPSEHGEFIRL
ncbi:Tubulin--tyrosine ligase-like protein 12 [Hondaea fermentalgiana]|uniref:Tubulin--tyrosine ligase-like protein 12 n=1 Tax=Hondaea fermentalgiana TaxID=2315210 RepID=A0A2R5GBF6_9STRA|nr:Tubulin--tyrosine ligase-like protein 12 [Hondaea fermentalgiana]|eukprot:GBG27048.1 Tubulin--tyrosine ligase-like protein 12 [Hondaea fermentalgiana]